MRIKKMHLTDYKRFNDLTIDLGETPSRIIALVGPNGCGKSSIFDAMLYIANYHWQIGDSGQKDYKYHSLSSNPGFNYQNVKITFDEGDFDQVYQIKSASGRHRTIFSFRSCFRYNGELNVRESKAVDSLIDNTYGASYASAIDQRIEQNYRRLKIKYDTYLQEEDCKPSEARSHIIGELNAAITNCLALEIDNLGSIESGNGTLFFSKKDTLNSFSFNVLSSGEKEVIDILLDLYLRKDEYTDSIYIIDEPELHLNTAIQRKLLIEINKMIPENCQIWVATHSAGFLRALQDELNNESQIIEFREDNLWASQVYELKPIVKSRSAWKSLFKTALDDLAELVSPKRIVYCEGRAEPTADGGERGLDAIVYNTIFGEAYPDTLFVSSGGHTALDQRSEIAIAILSKVFQDIEILVLKDRDMASGRETDETTRQKYLANNPKNHRVLNRLEIENYLYDKEVLEAYCANYDYSFNETAYEECVKDILNQHVKDETGKIKNICDITVSISSDTFKKNLAEHIKPSMNVYKELEAAIFERK